MRGIGKCVLVLAVLFLGGAATAQQGAPAPRKSAFGFSLVTYVIEPGDGVYTDNDRHATQNFGFRFNKAFRGQRPVGWMVDGELFRGVVDRELLDAPLPETMFGLHAFVGPQYSTGAITFYAAGGVNRTSVPGTEVVSASRQAVIQYVGRGGLSRLWAAQLNNLASRGQNTVLASIPEYSSVSPAGMMGIAFDFGKSAPGRRGLGFRLSADFLPVFAGPTRNNFRTTFSITG